MEIDHSIAKVLAETDVFGNLPAEGLLALAERAQYRRMRKGQKIFVQGERGDSLYVLAKGMVRIILTRNEYDVVELARIWPPTVFGLVAPLTRLPRTSGAEAVEASLLIWLHRDDLIPLLSTQPQLVDAMFRWLGLQLFRRDQQLADRYFLPLRSRVALKLLELAANGSLHLGISQLELAMMVGGTRQSVNSIVIEFERRELISGVNRGFQILNPQELRRISEG